MQSKASSLADSPEPHRQSSQPQDLPSGNDNEDNNVTTMVSQQRRRHHYRPRRVKIEDFSSLESSHPYGVLPGGNRFFSMENDGAIAMWSSSEQDLFTDDIWQNLLSFCDGQTLACIVQSSRYLYVAGHQPELWRDLVLRGCSSPSATTNVISNVGKSWKDTFVLNFYRKRNYTPHRPMCVPGVYSDTYYRTHLCRSFAIPPCWLDKVEDVQIESLVMSSHNCNGEVPRVSVNSISPHEFLESYEKRNIPVVIAGATQNSPAVHNWNIYEYFSIRQPQERISFRTTSGAAPLPGNFTLDAYHDYCHYPYLEESPLYLFDRTAISTGDSSSTPSGRIKPKTHAWFDDFFPELYKCCPYWDPSADYGHDLLQHLGRQKRPDHTWLIAGPKRSGSVFHLDPNCTHAWNACIVGRKRWIFYPPGCTPPGVHPSADGDEVAIPLSVGEWLTQYWDEHTDQYKKQPPNRCPMECTTHPGDVIFVPHGWWHMVINLDGPFNIAITHNYVSQSNLGNVLRFFRNKQEQISGCRDRKESIKPESLHREFSEALKRICPSALAKATEQTGWTCAAWQDHEDNDCENNNRKRCDVAGYTDKKNSIEYDAIGENQHGRTGDPGDHAKRSKTENDGGVLFVESAKGLKANGDKFAERGSIMAKLERNAFSFSFL